MVDSVTKAKPPERFQTGKPSRGEKAARIVKWDEESRRGRSDHPGMGAAPCPRVPLGQLQAHQPVCCCCPAVPCGQCPFTSACQRRNLSLRGFRRLRPTGSRDRACASSCSLPLRGIVGNQAPARCMLGSAEKTSQTDVTTTARDATPLSSDCSHVYVALYGAEREPHLPQLGREYACVWECCSLVPRRPPQLWRWETFKRRWLLVSVWAVASSFCPGDAPVSTYWNCNCIFRLEDDVLRCIRA